MVALETFTSELGYFVTVGRDFGAMDLPKGVLHGKNGHGV